MVHGAWCMVHGSASIPLHQCVCMCVLEQDQAGGPCVHIPIPAGGPCVHIPHLGSHRVLALPPVTHLPRVLLLCKRFGIVRDRSARSVALHQRRNSISSIWMDGWTRKHVSAPKKTHETTVLSLSMTLSWGIGIKHEDLPVVRLCYIFNGREHKRQRRRVSTAATATH